MYTPYQYSDPRRGTDGDCRKRKNNAQLGIPLTGDANRPLRTRVHGRNGQTVKTIERCLCGNGAKTHLQGWTAAVNTQSEIARHENLPDEET